MKKQVVDKDVVIAALKEHPGDAFAKLKREFMALVLKTALDETNGNIKEASTRLGITRKTFYTWMSKKP